MKYWQLIHHKELEGLNLKFLCVHEMEEITTEMWDELEKYVMKENIIIQCCRRTFEKANIKNFYIPDPYMHLFDRITDCENMFRYAKIETMNITFKSRYLVNAREMCQDCRHLKHLSVKFEGAYRLNLTLGFSRCEHMKTAKLTIDNPEVYLSATFHYCRDASTILITFNAKPCIIRRSGFGFQVCNDLKWFRIIGVFKYKDFDYLTCDDCESLFWEPTFSNVLFGTPRSVCALKYCSDIFTRYNLDTQLIHCINYQADPRPRNCRGGGHHGVLYSKSLIV